MPFDYGPTPPPEPSPAQVMDVLFAAARSEQVPASPAVAAAPPTMIGLDTGRFDTGVDAPTATLTGLLDSELFRPDTNEAPPGPRLIDIDSHHHQVANTDVAAMAIESTHYEGAAVSSVVMADLDTGRSVVVDVAAGGTSAATMLDLTHHQRPMTNIDVSGGVRTCANCGTRGNLSRCLSCGARLASGPEEG
jgi:hypothetical protein